MELKDNKDTNKVKNHGASAANVEDAASSAAAALDANILQQTGVTQAQMSELLKTVMAATGAVSTTIGAQAAAEFLAKAKPEIEIRTEEVANKAVAEALARKQKSSTMKQHGATAAVSAAVFALGTLTLFGIDKFRHRGDSRANAMNPQYQDAHPPA